jgi:hypothetical protein
MDNKVILTMATAALVLSVVSITRRELEIKYLREVRDLMSKVDTELQYAQIISHLNDEE